MKIQQPPMSLISEIIIDSDLDMDDTHQVKNLASPALTEALRKGSKDITNSEISDTAAIDYTKLSLTGLIRNADIKTDAAIAVSKLVNTFFPETLMTTRGDLIIRGAANPERLPKITTGELMVASATGYSGVANTMPQLIHKPADQYVQNSTILVNDDTLFLPVLANEVWSILLALRVYDEGALGNQADFKMAWAVPTNGTLKKVNTFGAMALEVDGTSAQQYSVTNDLEYDELFTRLFYWGGNTAGNVQLQWAQQTAKSGKLYVLQHSFIIAHKLA